MKAKEFGCILESFSAVSAAFGDVATADSWRKLGAFFQAQSTPSAAQVCNRLTAVEQLHSDRKSTFASARQIAILAAALSSVAKKGVVEALNALATALLHHGDVDLDELLATASQPKPSKPRRKQQIDSAERQKLVDTHLSNLDQSFGDETLFVAAFKALKNDTRLNAQALKFIAKAFAKETANSKPQAISLIWGRHATLMEARAKAAATGGRTAA